MEERIREHCQCNQGEQRFFHWTSPPFCKRFVISLISERRVSKRTWRNTPPQRTTNSAPRHTDRGHPSASSGQALGDRRTDAPATTRHYSAHKRRATNQILNRPLDASCLHSLSPVHVFADVKYNKPFPRQFPVGGIEGERACDYRKSARLDYAL